MRTMSGVISTVAALLLGTGLLTGAALAGEDSVVVEGVVAAEAADAEGNKVLKIVGEKDTYVVKKHPEKPELIQMIHGIPGGRVKAKGKVTVTETGKEIVVEEIIEKAPAAAK